MPKLKLLIILLAWEIVTGSPVEIEKIAEAIETERELDLEGGILPRNVRQRMARFFTDATDAGSAGADLLDLGLDSNAIMRGVLSPENIAIHVAQNAVNFFSSSIAWLALGAFASQTALSGRGIDPELLPAAGHGGTSPASLVPVTFGGNAMMLPMPQAGRNVGNTVKTLPTSYKPASTSLNAVTLNDLPSDLKQKILLQKYAAAKKAAVRKFTNGNRRDGDGQISSSAHQTNFEASRPFERARAGQQLASASVSSNEVIQNKPAADDNSIKRRMALVREDELLLQAGHRVEAERHQIEVARENPGPVASPPHIVQQPVLLRKVRKIVKTKNET